MVILCQSLTNMTHIYSISGMTCGGCEAKVKGLLSGIPAVKKVDINLQSGEATIEMDRHVGTGELQAALKEYPKYQLQETHHHPTERSIPQPSWLSTYKPILLVFLFIAVITAITSIAADTGLMHWMRQFMAGFFLTFSFFKFLDLTAFADSYSTYDIIAARWRGWGYIYPFAEATLGIGYLTGFDPMVTNTAAFLIMSVSIIGVLRSVMNKQKIKCACLGTVFNLPMSTITIIEDGLMITMSAVTLIATQL
jgi:copper chaperone CopZ